MIEDYNRKIIDKLNNDDINFTLEEALFISINEELMYQFARYFNTHPNIEVLDYMDYKSFDTIISSNYLEDFLGNENCESFLLACLKAIAKYNNELTDDYRDIINEEQAKDYLEYINSLMDKNENFSLNNLRADEMVFFYNRGKLKQIIKAKSFDIYAEDEVKIRHIIDQMETVPSEIASVIRVRKDQLPLDFMLEHCKIENPYAYLTDYDYGNDKTDTIEYDITIDDIIEKTKSLTDISEVKSVNSGKLYDLYQTDRKDELIDLFLSKGLVECIEGYIDDEFIDEHEEQFISIIRNPKTNLTRFNTNNHPNLIREMILNNRISELYFGYPESLEYYVSLVPDFKERLINYIRNEGKILQKMCETGDKDVNEAIVESITSKNCYSLAQNIYEQGFEYYLEKNDIEKLALIANSFYDFKSLVTEEALNKLKERIGENIYNDYKLFNLLLNKELLFINQDILNVYLGKGDYFVDKILEYASHQEESLGYYNENLFERTKELICKRYNLNQNHYELLAHKLGYELLRYIESSRIQTIINFNDEGFNKLLDLLKNVKFDKNTTLSLFDAAMQYKFGKDKKDIVSARVNIINSVESGSIEYFNYIYDIVELIETSDQFYKFYPQYTSIKGKELNYLLEVCEKMKTATPEEKEECYKIIRDFSDYYIKQSREKYRKEHDMYETLDIPFKYEMKSLKRAYIKYSLAGSCRWMLSEIFKEKFGLNRGEIEEILDFFCGATDTLDEKHRKNFGKYSKEIFDYCENLIKTTKYETMADLAPTIESTHGIKINKVYEYERKDSVIFKLLADLNPSLLQNFILNPEHQKEYDKLKSILTKYNLLSIPEYFTKLNEQGVDISFDPANIRGFIEYFTKIYDEELSILLSSGEPEEKMDFGILSCLKKAESFSSSSNIYQIILGSEDERLIKSNPGPNAAQTQSTQARLEKSVENTVKNFQRKKLHIPTFNEVLDISKNKQMRVVVGNFTHPSTLTHGERTGACMRIGGAGQTLYNFCLEDPHGFHIRFEDPVTGKYISRVSGFRNGNTVFLNELRNSCDPNKYSDEEIIEACRKAADMLIELSKDSMCPIENVVVHRAYATQSMDRQDEHNLGVNNIKQGLKNFYSDVNGKAIVLSTTQKPFKKVELGIDNLPEYLPAREIPYEGKVDINIVNKINRVKTVKLMLEGQNYQYISIETLDPDKLVFASVNEDFYVYVDEDGNIFGDMIDLDPRCKEEYDHALEVSREFISSKSKFKEKKEEQEEQVTLDSPIPEYQQLEEETQKRHL